MSSIDFSLSPLAAVHAAFHNSFEQATDLFEFSGGSQVGQSDTHVTDGSFSMRVLFSQAAVDSFVATENINPSDFTAYDALTLDAYNASPYLTELELDLYDAGWTHFFYEIFFLPPGRWSHLRLPVSRVAPVAQLPGFDLSFGTTSHYGGSLGAADLTGNSNADLLAARGPDPAADTMIAPYLYTGTSLLPLPSVVPFPYGTYGANADTINP